MQRTRYNYAPEKRVLNSYRAAAVSTVDRLGERLYQGKPNELLKGGNSQSIIYKFLGVAHTRNPMRNFSLSLIMKLDKNNLDAIKKLCRVRKVKSLFAFGSVTRDDFTDESDVDFIVDFDESDPLRYSDLYFDFKDRLEGLLRRRVDLLEERAIRNPFLRKELDQTKVKIYGH